MFRAPKEVRKCLSVHTVVPARSYALETSAWAKPDFSYVRPEPITGPTTEISAPLAAQPGHFLEDS